MALAPRAAAGVYLICAPGNRDFWSTRRPSATGILSRWVSLTGQAPRFRVPSQAASGRSPMGRLRMRSGSSRQQQTPPMVVCRSNDRVSLILLPVVLVLVLLPAIAFASPPDPSWIPGIYDGADGDEIVNLVYDTSAVTTAASSYISPLRSMPKIPIERIAPRLPGRRFAQGPRAPPAADSNVSAHGFTLPACSTHTASHTKLPSLARRSQNSHLCLVGSIAGASHGRGT